MFINLLSLGKLGYFNTESSHSRTNTHHPHTGLLKRKYINNNIKLIKHRAGTAGGHVGYHSHQSTPSNAVTWAAAAN